MYFISEANNNVSWATISKYAADLLPGTIRPSVGHALSHQPIIMKIPHSLIYYESDECSFSVEGPSSQMTLAYVELTKNESQHKRL